ncbi:hypothetical protein [Nocardiopsis synnemataformans]|uniref:hypothetical protein n=1 Tax=Nocardiopsis synnemataformans TaxID=61305 RepID=UPI003EBC35E5
MRSYTINLPDTVTDEQYTRLMHSSYESAAAACGGERNVEVIDDGKQPYTDHQKQWETSGQKHRWKPRQEASTSEPHGAADLPTLRFTPSPLSLIYTAAQLLDTVAPLYPTPVNLYMENVNSPEPEISFQLDAVVDQDDRTRSVDIFADALGAEALTDPSGRKSFTTLFQGVKLTVTTGPMKDQTWCPPTSWDYQAGQHAEELLMLSAFPEVLRVTPGQNAAAGAC